MSKIDRHGNARKFNTEKEPQLTLTLYSSSDYTHHRFSVPARTTVSDFLELALERLGRGKGAERVQELRDNYEPVLELPSPDGGLELSPDKSLFEAGVFNHAVCRIVARPRKDRIMFCRYSNYS